MDKQKLITIQQAQVLTPRGFYKQWRRYLMPGISAIDAYEKTEAMHRETHELGTNKYSEFLSFARQARRYNQEVEQFCPSVIRKRKASLLQ